MAKKRDAYAELTIALHNAIDHEEHGDYGDAFGLYNGMYRVIASTRGMANVSDLAELIEGKIVQLERGVFMSQDRLFEFLIDVSDELATTYLV